MSITSSIKQFLHKISNILDLIFSNSIYLYSLLTIYFILKVIFSIYISFDGVQVEDWSIAYNIATYNQYSEFLIAGPCAYKLPMYPLFVAFFIKVFGISYAKIAIVIVQHAIFSILPLIFIKIGKEINRIKESQFTSLLFLISPSYFYYSNAIEVTNITIPILSLWLLFAFKIYSQNSKIKYLHIYFALLTGILSLTQVLFVPSLLLFFIILYRKIAFKKFLLICSISLIVYSPWVLRNYIILHTFIPSRTPIWQNQYSGYMAGHQYFKDLKIIPDSKVHQIDSMRKITSDVKMENIYKKIVLDIQNKDNTLIIKKALANFFYLWYTPTRYLEQNSFSILISRKLYSVFLNALTIFAIIYMWKIDRKLILIMLYIFISFSFPYMLTHATNVRFKLDFEWLQLFFVSCYFVTLKSKSNQTYQKIKLDYQK